MLHLLLVRQLCEGSITAVVIVGLKQIASDSGIWITLVETPVIGNVVV
jgi:hypothetical protein